MKDLIEEEDIIVCLDPQWITLNVFQLMNLSLQHRGGRGVKGMGVHKDDFIEQLISSSTHDMLLFFTNSGKVYSQ